MSVYLELSKQAIISKTLMNNLLRTHMREKTELHEDINSAKQAEAIIKHPLFIAALSTLRELTVSKFESLGFKDITEMQECNIRLNLIEELEANLFTVIQNGDIAFSTLEQIQTHEQAMNNEY